MEEKTEKTVIPWHPVEGIDEPTYLGAEQWANDGFCEYCRRSAYCTKKDQEGCTPKKYRTRRINLRKEILFWLETGVTPEQIGVPETLLEELGIEWIPPNKEEETE